MSRRKMRPPFTKNPQILGWRPQFVLMALSYTSIDVINQVWLNIKDPVNEQTNLYLIPLDNNVRWQVLGVTPR